MLLPGTREELSVAIQYFFKINIIVFPIILKALLIPNLSRFHFVRYEKVYPFYWFLQENHLYLSFQQFFVLFSILLMLACIFTILYFLAIFVIFSLML